ncbi:MAG: endopeptidase La [Gemmatimonadota bacterium]
MPTLERVDDRFDVPAEVPVVALRDLVFFPYMVLPLLIGRPASVAALEEAERSGGFLLLLAQRDPRADEPMEADLWKRGTLARPLQVARLPDGTARVVLEGLGRAEATMLTHGPRGFRARISVLEPSREADLDLETGALVNEVVELFEHYVAQNARIPDELKDTLGEVRDRSRLGSLIAGHLLLPAAEKQPILAAVGVRAQFELLRDLLGRELEIARIEARLDAQIQNQLESERKQYYLQEQLKAIHRELGEGEDEWAALEAQIAQAPLPTAARERAEREFRRLVRLNATAPEASVIRTYLDWILGLPWRRRTEDRLDVEQAARLLDEAHHGLGEVKERILDHVAVLSLVGEMTGPILCLVGPPGVGKTSLGKSIAESVGREFVRVSLGGVRDEAEIRGHRRTYVGALPGRILQGMRRSGSRNPVFLLDEVDKMARDFHGDPGAALLEVLDPEQNRTFTDHYLELEFDLSDVLFVATANTLQEIPEPLRDRMEVIRIPGYLDTEKKSIARSFLWPRQARKHGLDPSLLSLSEGALDRILDRYTREAGVRELDQRMSRMARKLARRQATGRATEGEIAVGAEDLRELLGPPPYLRALREEGLERTGIANGLAWTSAGGEVLDVEVAVVPGTGQIQLTGTLGDVMKESAAAAMTYARSRGPVFGLDERFYQNVDIHIHLPEGATPKDGPSAGITIAVALISALTGTPTRADVALTGEITLRGRVLAVGGIKEKAVAALRGGVRTVLLPQANLPDLEMLPDEVRAGLRFQPVSTMDEVLEAALLHRPLRTPRSPALGSADPGVQISQ